MFGHIEHNISLLEETIDILDSESNSRSLNQDELYERCLMQQNLWSWLRRKEQFWAQTSRAKWLKEGDKNTCYFHTLASIHKRRNTITFINVNGTNFVDCAGIQREAVKYFKNIFKEEFPSRPVFDDLEFKRLDPQQVYFLSHGPLH